MSTAGGPVRIAIVEDHEATRLELVASFAAVESRVRLVAAFEDAESFLDSPLLAQVDVALVDLGLPGTSGVDAIRLLEEKAPRIRAIALTAFDDEASLIEALSAGAFGYLLKDEVIERVIAAVEEAALGEHPISSRVAGFLVSRARTVPRPVALTDREEALGAALAEGLSYAECATRMQIALSTVQHHVKNLYRKLEVSSRNEVREWMKRYPAPR